MSSAAFSFSHDWPAGLHARWPWRIGVGSAIAVLQFTDALHPRAGEDPLVTSLAHARQAFLGTLTHGCIVLGAMAWSLPRQFRPVLPSPERLQTPVGSYFRRFRNCLHAQDIAEVLRPKSARRRGLWAGIAPEQD